MSRINPYAAFYSLPLRTEAGKMCIRDRCGVLTACGHKEPSHALSPEQTESQSTEAEPEIRIDTQRGSQSDKASEHPIGSGSTAATADSAQGEAGYRLIKDQTFDVDLEPLGGVTFAVSYTHL